MNARRARFPRAAAALAAGLLLTGCGDDISGLRHYADGIKQRAGGELDPIPQMQPFESYAYPEDPLRSPFRARSFARPEPQAGRSAAAGPKPDPTRPREALEAFPLDALSYVGTIAQNDQQWALVQAPDGTIHRLQTGNYMGRNYGRITVITPTAIELRELASRSNGGWVKRHAELALKD